MSPSLDPATPHLNRLLDSRAFPKTICPSEVARALSAAELQRAGVTSWRDLMPAMRERAFELRDEGVLEILQKGEILPVSQTMQQTVGPIRLRRKVA
ncbi:hypothetical protein GJ744_000527 [Endocarpon pusillum]|uniref:DUF3253 domain-containing protein n=1 Tax=Endocarpon pusillum TaxID=364733 RepID=A0A8H7E2G9_9EURO|nr:hypothetical protein GJ744_000527 [Endocarpon pusillum]